jgi:diguanylate cyclase (GGDEF)-like protein/PAS domain S-box-containing protein
MSGERILITEDEKITALDLQKTLERLGYTVVDSVACGEDSIASTRQNTPDLVLMDIHLKTEMLGTEAAKVIHDEMGIPVVFLSAYSDRSVVKEAGESTPYGYLIKPYDPREIDATIQVALAKHSVDHKVQNSDRKLRMALDAANMSAWEWVPEDSDLAPVNNINHSILSQDIEYLVNRLHPDDQVSVVSKLKEEGQVTQQVRIRQEGEERFLNADLYAAVVPDQKNGSKVVGVIRDIEEEFQKRERLRQAEVVFDSISEAILITDAERKILSTNPAFETITGYSRSEAMGLDPDHFLHARRQKDNVSKQLMEKGNHFWSGEVACNTKSGTRFPAWEHVAGVFDDDGNIINYVFSISDIGELRRAEKSLQRMAYLDSLTGIGNRVHLERSLSSCLARQKEYPQPVAVMYIDLDGFKLINDTLGHAEGDRLLQIIAERFVSSVRDEDIVTRVGGDEFVIVVPSFSDEEGLKVMAEKLLHAVSEPITLSREVVEVSASIGISVSGEELVTHDDIITAADTALFHAKDAGKSCFKFYDFELAMVSVEKNRIERNMKGALTNDEICIEFQPLIDMNTGSIYGAEALCRWYSRELGMISPERFIPIAEQSNAILQLGEKVLTESCKQVKEWNEAGWHDLVVSVNVSARQLSDKNFPNIIKALLDEHAISPQSIELEVTETSIQNNKYAKEQLERIKRLGLRLAIDDFGTGYSSLSRLKSLPFDRVKIDRSFVRDLPHSESDVEICKAILALCNVLGMRVTAEGIERQEQLELLREIGCHCAQGFLFSKAMSPEKFSQWVSEFGQGSRPSTESHHHRGV